VTPYERPPSLSGEVLPAKRTTDAEEGGEIVLEALVSDEEKRQANGLIRSLGRLEQAMGMMPYFERMPAPYPEME
jgi:hypothetical protein